jgi:hypothetical protein
MSVSVFNTATESYQVSKIAYAGPIGEIPEDRRKYDNTHSFKIVTSLGAGFCYFKDQEKARSAQNALRAMLNAEGRRMFHHGYQVIDPEKIVSFSNVLTLKTSRDECTHAVVVTVETSDQNNQKIWLRYKSEENARKGRKALYASILSRNDTGDSSHAEETGETQQEETPAPAENLPF